MNFIAIHDSYGFRKRGWKVDDIATDLTEEEMKHQSIIAHFKPHDTEAKFYWANKDNPKTEPEKVSAPTVKEDKKTAENVLAEMKKQKPETGFVVTN